MDAVRRVPVDDGLRLRPDLLRDQVQRDRADGLLPIAVVATAGTTSTGAIDPLPEIADVCAEQGLWMHVDAAYGGPAVLADDLRPLMAGIERADSIAFDPHKWLYIPLAAGCVLVRDVRRMPESFHIYAAYVHQDEEHTGAGVSFGDAGAAVQPRLPGAEAVGVAARPRHPGLRRSHLPRCRAGPLHRRPRRAATGVRAGRAGRALDLLLPLRAAGGRATTRIRHG